MLHQGLLYKKLSVFEDANIEVSCWYPIYRNISAEKDREYYRSFAFIPRQTHSTNIGLISTESPIPADTDAIITCDCEFPIGIITADCVPIVLYAPDIKCIGAIHAGWRGTIGEITAKTIRKLIESGAKPENIIVFFGPSISQQSYEVDNDLAQRFRSSGYEEAIRKSTSEIKPHLDLQEVNCIQLISQGVPDANIHRCNLCTYNSLDNSGKPLFQSYRRDNVKAGRNLLAIKMKLVSS